MEEGYIVVGGFPVTIMNCVWFVMSCILIVSYLVNYVFPTGNGNFIMSATRYLTIYGKAKPISQFADVPKRYFVQFYWTAFVYNVACLITIIGLCFNQISKNWIADFFLLHERNQPKGDQLTLILVMILLTSHTGRRLYECLFVSVFSNKAKISFIQYVWGFVYYLLIPPLLICENLPLQNLPFGSFSLRHFIGIWGFVVASYIQYDSHVIFGNMRKKDGLKQESHGIPMGGFFKLVSCPHYFAEVLIYAFTPIMIWPQCYSWLLLLSYNVIAHANMSMQSHLWYKATFKGYPSTRKAYIPHIL